MSVRRLAIFLRVSIKSGLPWVVFEPNGEPFWTWVRRNLESFQPTMSRNGAPLGSRPDKALFVRRDRATMSEIDIANGKLVFDVGMAPLKPTEFIVFRIAQKVQEP